MNTLGRYMLFQRNKLLLLLLGLFLIAVIFLVRANLKDLPIIDLAQSKELQEPVSPNGLQVSTAPNVAGVQPIIPPAVVDAKKVQEIRTVMGSPSEAEIVKKWRISNGDPLYMSPEYESYSLETLQKLSDAGDIYAMQVLAGKVVFSTPDGKSKAKSLLLRAAVYGSTYAFNYQANHEQIDILNSSNEVERKELVIENLAYLKAAALRGDLSHYYRDMVLPLAGRFGVIITDMDAKEINTKAVALIDNLQKQRIALGLGEFDSSQPPEVKHFFENIDPRDLGHKPYF